MRIDSRMLDVIPKQMRSGLMMLPPVKRITDQVLADFGIPRSVLVYINYPTSFDSTNTQKALEGTGISVPPLPSYADRLWDYWERNLDPDLFKDRSLSGAIGGKTVMITGASSGIGKAAAIKAAEAGAEVLLVARTPEKLEETKAEIEEAGGAGPHPPLRPLRPRRRRADGDRGARPSTGRWTSSSTTPAARSGARSSSPTTASTTSSGRCSSTTSASLRLILSLLPGDAQDAARAARAGTSSTSARSACRPTRPRFSAYVASKAALDAWSRCVASEVIDDGVHITTIHMPLVRTPMIAPTKMYDAFPTITPEEAADMICDAMIRKPKKVATRLGNFGELLYNVAPKASDAILNTAYKLFPESKAAKGEKQGAKEGEQAGQGRGALDRGRRLRLPDARRALVRRLALGGLLALALALPGTALAAPRGRLPRRRGQQPRAPARERGRLQGFPRGRCQRDRHRLRVQQPRRDRPSPGRRGWPSRTTARPRRAWLSSIRRPVGSRRLQPAPHLWTPMTPHSPRTARSSWPTTVPTGSSRSISPPAPLSPLRRCPAPASVPWSRRTATAAPFSIGPSSSMRIFPRAPPPAVDVALDLRRAATGRGIGIPAPGHPFHVRVCVLGHDLTPLVKAASCCRTISAAD